MVKLVTLSLRACTIPDDSHGDSIQSDAVHQVQSGHRGGDEPCGDVTGHTGAVEGVQVPKVAGQGGPSHHHQLRGQGDLQATLVAILDLLSCH